MQQPCLFIGGNHGGLDYPASAATAAPAPPPILR
jgi:hypothetical protein